MMNHGWCGGAKSLHHSGSEMPSGYPVPPWTALCPNPSQACWAKARLGKGGLLGESLARESWWVSGVLIDTKLVAKIGERHLVSCGSRSLRRKSKRQ